ncbi:MAG TPA: response regulator [Polyangia bacterium]|nr:response regulator [Polyangia bacterium]
MAKRILIADDSVTIQKAFAMTFAAEDITLMPARSADEGLSLARQMRPDLVIADGVMPGRSGYDLCAAIKAEPTLRGTLVYILSSTQQPYDETRGRQIGADGHFIKPFESTAIIEKVRDAIARAVPVPAEAPRAPTPLGRPPLRSAPPPDDDYGEISVDVSPAREPVRPAAPAYAAPAMRPAAMAPSSLPASGAAAASGSPAMRPSLIPGLRPGAIPTARPGAIPVPAARPTGPGAAPPVQRPAAGRTLMGLPAANIPIPGSSRPGAPVGHPGAMPQARPSILSPSRPAPTPSSSPAPSSSPYAPAPTAPVASALGAAIGSAVDAKVAAFAAKGPEYEALAKLSREVIEQIVWEIVPELAEAIIREHLEKRGRI